MRHKGSNLWLALCMLQNLYQSSWLWSWQMPTKLASQLLNGVARLNPKGRPQPTLRPATKQARYKWQTLQIASKAPACNGTASPSATFQLPTYITPVTSALHSQTNISHSACACALSENECKDWEWDYKLAEDDQSGHFVMASLPVFRRPLCQYACAQIS